MGESNGMFLRHFLASQNKATTGDNVFVRVVLKCLVLPSNDWLNR